MDDIAPALRAARGGCVVWCRAGADAERPACGRRGAHNAQAVTETSEFIGRIQAIDRVALTARVTAFLEQRLFIEGTEVKAGRPALPPGARRRSRPRWQQQEAAVADASARLANANIQLARAQSLLNTPAGQRSTVDDATAASALAGGAGGVGTGAVAHGADQPGLHRDPRADRRQDQPHQHHASATSSRQVPARWRRSSARIRCMCVFPISVRAETELEKRYADKGGMNAVVIRLRLPDGTTVRPDRQDRLHRADRRRPPPTRSCCAARSPIRRSSRSSRASRSTGR